MKREEEMEWEVGWKETRKEGIKYEKRRKERDRKGVKINEIKGTKWS